MLRDASGTSKRTIHSPARTPRSEPWTTPRSELRQPCGTRSRQGDEHAADGEDAALRDVEVGHVSLLVQRAGRTEVGSLHDGVAVDDVPGPHWTRVEALPMPRPPAAVR